MEGPKDSCFSLVKGTTTNSDAIESALPTTWHFAVRISTAQYISRKRDEKGCPRDDKVFIKLAKKGEKGGRGRETSQVERGERREPLNLRATTRWRWRGFFPSNYFCPPS